MQQTTKRANQMTSFPRFVEGFSLSNKLKMDMRIPISGDVLVNIYFCTPVIQSSCLGMMKGCSHPIRNEKYLSSNHVSVEHVWFV